MKAYFLHNQDSNIDILLEKLNFPNGCMIPYEKIQEISLLIPWGNIEESYSIPFVLNKKANQILNNKYEQYKIFNIQGISTPIFFDEFSGQAKLKKLRYTNIYHVAVFGQNIIGIFKQKKAQTANWLNKSVFSLKENKNVSEIQLFATKREEKRVKELAIRSVYSLHLDYGIATIGITSGEKPWILQVNPSPFLNEKLASRYAKIINQFVVEWEKLFERANHQNVTLGTDPEFVLRDMNGNMVLASNFFPRKGSVGCDDIWTNHDRSQLPIAELRPNPSTDPRQLVIHLYQTMILASKRIKNTKIDWLAGALPFEGFPIGGHIHFSNIELNSFLLRALDNYLTLTISQFEDPEGKKRRPKYGYLGDYREKSHKGFEYRTLPSWIVSPTLTKGVFALSKLIAENYLFLYQDPLYEPEIQKAYYVGDKEKLKPIILKLWEELKQLKDFDKYRTYLEPIEKFIKIDYEWNEKKDIRKVWKLPPYHR